MYHVDVVNGNDSYPGTGKEPFRTVEKAAGVVKPGDTVIVREGVYEEMVQITTSGTKDAWITFKANPGDRVLMKVAAGSWGNYGRPFDINANYIHIEGFELTSPGYGGKGIYINGTEKKPLHHFRIYNNTVYDCGGSGIGASYADYLHIRGNTVYRNAFLSPWQESGINHWEGRAFDNKKDYHNIIENNIAYDNYNKYPPYEFDSEGNMIFLSEETSDGNGIIIDWCRDTKSSTLVRNNICFNNGGRGIQVTASANVTVINNTMFMNSRDKYSIGEFGNHTVDNHGGINIILKNNILYALSGAPCLTIWDKPGCVYDYNLYFNETGVNAIGDIKSSDRNAGNHGRNNILNQDPQFVNIVKTIFVNNIDNISNPADYDFSLKSTSPCINAGNESEDTDFFGNRREKNDLGAIAF